MPAGGPTVSVANMRFTRATLKASLGSTVIWSSRTRWDSGSKWDGESYAHTFGSAGSFAYRRTFHPSAVKVTTS